MYISAETAERIKIFAKERNISVTNLLEQCELNKNTVSSMLSRGSWIQANSLAKIADYLDCSVDYLLGRDTNPQKKTSPSFDELALGIIGDDANLAKAYNALTSLSDENLALALKFLDLLVSQQAGSNNQ